MKRQRNTAQMKEQTRNTQVQINEEEISKLPEKEFRIMIVKMIKNLENKMEKMQESINKNLEELKNKHTETNNTITEIKNTLEGTKGFPDSLAGKESACNTGDPGSIAGLGRNDAKAETSILWAPHAKS